MLPEKSNKYLRLIAILFLALSPKVFASGQGGYGQIKSEIQRYTSDLPFTMPEVKLPQFPDVVFDIKSYGAVGDGQTMNTGAFKRAIDACSNAGGGTVVVPPGLWLTGPIELKSNVNFHLKRGALVLFSRNHDDYPIIKSPTRGFVVASPVYGFNLENVAITGTGLLDGSGITWRPVKKAKVTSSMWKELTRSGGFVTDDGKMWWPSEQAANGAQYIRDLKARKDKKELTAEDFLPAKDFMRPILLLLSKCRNVLVDGVTLENSPAFALYPDRCEDVVIRNVKVNNEYWAQNGDGIDIASSKNVLVYKCTVTAGDDGICMKSSRDKTGNAALQNIVIADCVVYHAHGGFVMGSNTDGGMENISVKNCDFVGTDIGLRFKSARERGGLVKDIYISNIYMKDIVNEAILFDTYYEESQRETEPQPVTDKTPVFEKFYIDSLYCNGARQAVRVAGLPEMPIKDITISNTEISADRGFSSEFASGFTLSNVGIMPKTGDVFSLRDTKNFKIEEGFCPANTDVFMSLEGKGTYGIKITNTDLSSAKTPVKYGPDVDKNAVTQK
jgi:polygalacturonase